MSAETHDNNSHYYVPHGSHWPILGSVALFFIAIGLANLMNAKSGGGTFATFVFMLGLALMVSMMVGWFGTVISESTSGKYNSQVDKSFRWGMSWFIFSEVMFFAAFFGALFYVRAYSVPWLGGEGGRGVETFELLWPHFDAIWPLIHPPGVENHITKHAFDIPESIVGPWGVPAINTLILLSSGVTLTWAHWGLQQNNRQQLVSGLAMTVFLGFLFLLLQAHEYHHAIGELNLTLSSGIYGSTFYMLTGFHGFHVTLGAIMLTVILIRSTMGHFSAHNHFGFEAVAWYWHFVDVVWLGLFIFVYWL